MIAVTTKEKNGVKTNMYSFQHYHEMALRIREKSLPEKFTKKEGKTINEIFEKLKSKLNSLKTKDDELFFSAKSFNTNANFNGTFSESLLQSVIIALRKFEKEFPEVDIDFEKALIPKKDMYAFSIDLEMNKRLKLKD